ncbi:hypothetical protein MMC17_008294 [Xylographa soralifera]|nr:hypothetical protein [Xylographa soralifera]
MTDYSKYTVVKLKEELKARGLPQTGLKAILITRLSEAVSLEKAPVVADGDEATENAPPSNSEDVSLKINGFINPDSGTPEEASIEGSEGTIKGDKIEDGQEEVQSPLLQAVVHKEENSVQRPAGHESSAVGLSAQEQSLVSTAPIETSTVQVNEDTLMPEVDEDSAVSAAAAAATTEVQPLETQLSQTDPQPDSSEIPQTSANKNEILDDSRKRKRRSHSPPPSTFDSALKKAKALDGSPRVRLPEDMKQDPEPVGNTLGKVDRSDSMEVDGVSSEDVQTQQLSEEKVSLTPRLDNAESLQESGHGLGNITTKQSPLKTSSTQIDDMQSPTKFSPSDTRFKNLFAAPAYHAEPPPTKAIYADIEDRDISPAIHPATSALYIRNFMRPLQPQSLKNHLLALANRSNDSPSPDVIIEFFLDSIKTHCLAQFTSVSAASRVRTALHDRVWPDERTRKPLYIDYVPEEKLKKWIEVEQNGSSGRQQSAKRWEVVYEQEEDGVAAYLQEADGTGMPRPSITNIAGPQPKAPTGIKIVETKPQPAPIPKGDTGKGFKALDDLFKSTAAKPKLYYQPVAESIANTRTERLNAARGGGRSDEMRRFTFEEDSIVDRGPEFGSGWRGGARGRGGYMGGYGGRGGGGGGGGGGGYRGGRGDSWR